MENLAKLFATITKEKQKEQEEKNKNLNSFSNFIKSMDISNKNLNENFGKDFDKNKKYDAFGKYFEKDNG